jgi:hypothetical protein
MARSIDARASHSTFTPKGTVISERSSPMMRAMVMAVIGSVWVRYGRLNSFENITPSTPPACRSCNS